MIQLYQSKSPRHAVPPVNAKDTTRVGVWLKNNSYREGDTMAYLLFFEIPFNFGQLMCGQSKL